MAIRVSQRFRILVRLLVYGIPVLSITLAFITLPTTVAVPFAILAAVAPFVLDRFIFVSSTALLMPDISLDTLKHMVGTGWTADDSQRLDDLTLLLVFNNRTAAREAFQVIRSWNYGRYSDREGNIVASFVLEGNGRYSIFVYPGHRPASLVGAEEQVMRASPPQTEVQLMVVKQFLHFCLDYQGDVPKQRITDALGGLEFLNLRVMFVDGDALRPYAKHCFRLFRFPIAQRPDILEGQIEALCGWSDPVAGKPRWLLETVERLRASRIVNDA